MDEHDERDGARLDAVLEVGKRDGGDIGLYKRPFQSTSGCTLNARPQAEPEEHQAPDRGRHTGTDERNKHLAELVHHEALSNHVKCGSAAFWWSWGGRWAAVHVRAVVVRELRPGPPTG